jgi:hypothetical protein
LHGGAIEENRSAIFIVSKQISEEALDVLYGDNFFQFGRYLISSTPREI